MGKLNKVLKCFFSWDSVEFYRIHNKMVKSGIRIHYLLLNIHRCTGTQVTGRTFKSIPIHCFSDSTEFYRIRLHKENLD